MPRKKEETDKKELDKEVIERARRDREFWTAVSLISQKYVENLVDEVTDRGQRIVGLEGVLYDETISPKKKAPIENEIRIVKQEKENFGRKVKYWSSIAKLGGEIVKQLDALCEDASEHAVAIESPKYTDIQSAIKEQMKFWKGYEGIYFKLDDLAYKMGKYSDTAEEKGAERS